MLDGSREIIEAKGVQFDGRSVSSPEPQTENVFTFKHKGITVINGLPKNFLVTKNRSDKALDESVLQNDAQGSSNSHTGKELTADDDTLNHHATIESSSTDGDPEVDLDKITCHPAVRRSEVRTAAGAGPNLYGFNQTLSVLEPQTADKNVPKSYKEATSRRDAAKWIKTLDFEFGSLNCINT